MATLNILGTPVTFCMPPDSPVPRKGPCPGKGKGGAVKKAVKKALKPKAVPKAKPAAEATPAKKTAPAKQTAGPRTLTREQAADTQKRMLTGNPWNGTQRTALADYSGFLYADMNSTLRGQEPIDYTEDEVRRMIRNTRAGLRPLPEPVKTFRGVSFAQLLGQFQPSREAAFEALKGLAGEKRQERGFSSTSIRDDLEDFTGEVLLEMDVPAGVPAAFIRELSDSPDEDELVLAPGLTYDFGPPFQTPDGKIRMKVKVSGPPKGNVS